MFNKNIFNNLLKVFKIFQIEIFNCFISLFHLATKSNEFKFLESHRPTKRAGVYYVLFLYSLWKCFSQNEDLLK